MRSSWVPAMLVVVCAGCGDSPAPYSSGPVAPPPVSATWSVSGIVTDGVTGEGVAGATLAFAGLPPATTDASGRWQVQGDGASPGMTVLAPIITAPGFVTRETRIEWRSGGRSDVALSLLPNRAPFSLEFYRKLVRNGHDAPDSLEPLRRWTKNPNFYLNAHNPRTGEKLTAAEIEMIERTVRGAVPELTGGSFSAGQFEIGVNARDQRDGYINIDIVYDPSADFCGKAFVGANPGRITLNYDRCRASWCRESLSPNVIAHEVGHAMGFWHTPDGVMIPEFNECLGTGFSEAERVHARLAYLRPNGSRDIDVDPHTFLALTTEGARQVVCYRAPRR